MLPFWQDGSVVTWGDAHYGGDSSAVRDQLEGVQQIQATSAAFAAILADGSVVTWGDAHCGGDSSAVRDQLKGVQQIQANHDAFAAILEDGSVVTWGYVRSGGDSSEVRDQLKGVQQIQASEKAFAAIMADGSVISWSAPFKNRSFGVPGMCKMLLVEIILVGALYGLIRLMKKKGWRLATRWAPG